MKIIPAILSGGDGGRLWPASRQANSKPFMTVNDSALLEQALVRGQVCGADECLIATNQDHFITLNEKNRLTNIGSAELVLIEVQCGECLREGDIVRVRLADTYGRTG